MANVEELPRALIERALGESPAESVEVSIVLLQLFSSSLSNLIGEGGFESLLQRATHRVGIDFPWLAIDRKARSSDPEFELLRRCFAAQEPEQVRLASILLFTTFIEILASLVGAHMTMLILNSALGRAHTSRNSKEQHDG